jgi:hypothetical protein
MTSAATLEFLSHYSVAIAQSEAKFVELFFFLKKISSVSSAWSLKMLNLAILSFAGKWQVGGYFAT